MNDITPMSEGMVPNRDKNDFYLGSNIFPSYDFNLVKLREMSAMKTATLLYGNGIKVDVSKTNPALKEFVQRLNEDNNFLDFMFTIERIIHIYGASITLINPLKSNHDGQAHYKWVFSNPFGGQYSYLFWNDLDSAQATCRLTHGKGESIYIFYNYNRYELKIEGFVDAQAKVPISEGNGAQKQIFHEFLTQNNLNTLIKNESGIVPAVIIKNYPTSTAYGNGFEEFLPEGSHLAGLQPVINQMAPTIMWELMANVTRAYLRMSEEEFNDMMKNLNADTVGKFISKGIFNVNPAGHTAQQQSENFFELQVANPQILQYLQALKEIIDLYLSLIGLSPVSLQEDTQRTATEVKSKTQNEFQVITLKRPLREEMLKLLIKRTVQFHNGYSEDQIKWDDADITITLNPTIEMDITEKVALQTQLLQMGLTTRIMAIQNIHNMTEEDAEELVKKIDAEQEIQREIEVEQANALGETKLKSEGDNDEPL